MDKTCKNCGFEDCQCKETEENWVAEYDDWTDRGEEQ